MSFAVDVQAHRRQIVSRKIMPMCGFSDVAHTGQHAVTSIFRIDERFSRPRRQSWRGAKGTVACAARWRYNEGHFCRATNCCTERSGDQDLICLKCRSTCRAELLWPAVP